MIGADVAAFIDGPVMILVSTRNDEGRAFIARGTGARFDRATGCIDVLVNSGLWPEVAGHAVPEARIAVTVVRPGDYRAYQVKGRICEVAAASGAEQARGRAYVERMFDVMGDLGVNRVQLSHTLTDWDLVRFSFTPTDLFVQTPGPGAGARLAQMGAS
ncbi:hypothetical protein [Mesorhizobium sp. ANAO-SY3R2]|uniref:hypothetical protein n=1 Tax=Mesorhizobium sp. ANAO-SY3R2 TaxID=3166644 RepID=UPI00366F6CA5